uniref:Major facilitator superfamily domain-containing protein 7-b n=1 Tax=Aceria tosichella TaxID=561515 RepID=A0A6G1SBM4_9ACAR
MPAITNTTTSTCKNARAETSSVSGEQHGDTNLSRSSSASTQVICNSPDLNPALSRKRWFILFAVSILGLLLQVSTGTSSVLSRVLSLLDLDVDSYLYIEQIFAYLMIILAVPSASFLDKFGIRVAVHTLACLFVLGGIFESLLFFTELPGWSHYKMYFYIISRIFFTETFCLFFLLPLKVSETWFPASERSAAWMIMFLQFDIGVCFTSFLYPRVIVSTKDFHILAYITIVSMTVALITCVALVTKSEPAIPPSSRAASKDATPVLVSLVRVFKHRDILLHMIHHSFITALFLTMGQLNESIYSSIGFSQVFAGNLTIMNSVTSFVLSFIIASFVHKVGNATLACKLGSLVQAAQFIVVLMAISYSTSAYVLAGVSLVLTCCRSWTIPHFNDMTASLASGVVSQATMVGFSLVVTPIIMSIVQVFFAYLIEIHGKKKDYHKSLNFLIVVCIINEVIYQIFFRGKSSTHSDNNDQLIENEEQINNCS